MFPEKSLAGEEWRLRNGRRDLNKAAMSSFSNLEMLRVQKRGCWILGTNRETGRKPWDNEVGKVVPWGGETVAGLGPQVAFQMCLSSPSLSWADDCHWVRLPQDRKHSGRSRSAIRAMNGMTCRWFGSLPPRNPTLRGKVVQGLSPESSPGAVP